MSNLLKTFRNSKNRHWYAFLLIIAILMFVPCIKCLLFGEPVSFSYLTEKLLTSGIPVSAITVMLLMIYGNVIKRISAKHILIGIGLTVLYIALLSLRYKLAVFSVEWIIVTVAVLFGICVISFFLFLYYYINKKRREKKEQI